MTRAKAGFLLLAAAAVFALAADAPDEGVPDAPPAPESAGAPAADAVPEDAPAPERPHARDFSMQAGQEMHGVRLPLRRHPGNGRVKELLTADRAVVDENGVVRVDGRIQVFDFDETGATNAFAVGLGGFFDPVRDYAECHGPVAFVRPGLVVAGTNLTWNAKTSVLRIETNAIVRFERGGRSVVDVFARRPAAR